MVSFKTAVKNGIKKTFTIEGRATRAEFWWYNIFIALLVSGLFGLGFGFEEVCRRLFSHETFKMIDVVITIPMIILLILIGISLLTLSVRRYHDVGVSGTIFFKYLIPIWWFYAGGPSLFDKGMQRDNEYGPNPYITDTEKEELQRLWDGWNKNDQ